MFLAPNDTKILGRELDLIYLFSICARDMENHVNEALMPVDI